MTKHGITEELEQLLLMHNAYFDADEIRFKCLYSDEHGAYDQERSAHFNIKTKKWHCDACDHSGDDESLLLLLRQHHNFNSDKNDTEKKKAKPNQAQQLVKLAARAKFSHTPDDDPYVTIDTNKHEETWPVRSTTLRSYLTKVYYMCTQKPPSKQALDSALLLLEAQARFDGPELPAFLRIAQFSDYTYLDLCNERWEVVEITPRGWSVISTCPVKFTRRKGMQALPRPQDHGDIELLKPFINVSNERDFQLVVAWLIAALRPVGPYPILVLQGEQGSAKSTTARMLRALVDPAAAPIRTTPKDERDLMIAAKNAWVLAFDNLSNIQNWLSDALCRLATGGGFATRRLYSDSEESIFESQRPIILNGIDDLIGRQDLLDRSIIVHLPSIPPGSRRPANELWERFSIESPRILGALLEAVSIGLERYHQITLPALPRMADFAKWVTATEPGFPWPEGFFLKTYEENRIDSIGASLEDDSVAIAIRELLDSQGFWKGTATELLAAIIPSLKRQNARGRDLPHSARVLSSYLRRATTFLRSAGVEIEFSREAGSGSRRLIVIKKVRQF